MADGKVRLPAEPKLQYWLQAHVDMRTIRMGPYETQTKAVQAAQVGAGCGVWDGRRLYPPHAIVFIEITEEPLA